MILANSHLRMKYFSLKEFGKRVFWYPFGLHPMGNVLSWLEDEDRGSNEPRSASVKSMSPPRNTFQILSTLRMEDNIMVFDPL